LLDADKTYEAVIKLGVATDSGDAEGQVIATSPVDVSETQLMGVLPRFSGDILQVPPCIRRLNVMAGRFTNWLAKGSKSSVTPGRSEFIVLIAWLSRAIR
jgi:hypothetical protein